MRYTQKRYISVIELLSSTVFNYNPSKSFIPRLKSSAQFRLSLMFQKYSNVCCFGTARFCIAKYSVVFTSDFKMDVTN